jgi:hypothetical protein
MDSLLRLMLSVTSSNEPLQSTVAFRWIVAVLAEGWYSGFVLVATMFPPPSPKLQENKRIPQDKGTSRR